MIVYSRNVAVEAGTAGPKDQCDAYAYGPVTGTNRPVPWPTSVWPLGQDSGYYVKHGFVLDRDGSAVGIVAGVSDSYDGAARELESWREARSVLES